MKSASSKIILCFCAVIFSTAFNSCRSQKVDLRTLAPGNTIVYLETDNLAKALKSLTENDAFREIAAETPDFSALENVQLAIAISSFETSENQITDENSVLNFTPRFVAVAETHLWQWQTVALVENQLDKFVRGKYGTDAETEKADKAGGKFFTWSARDGRRVFAFVKSGRIYFGNDRAEIEKITSLPNGESEKSKDNATPKNLFSARSENRLAIGYVSSEGIKQIADLAGVAVGAGISDEAAAQSFVARGLPRILRNTADEIIWTATRTDSGIEDVFKVSLKPETAAVTKEILNAGVSPPAATYQLPPEFYSVTRYNLKNPLIAWRGSLLIAARNADDLSGELLMKFSNSLLEPYGIADAENFLKSIDSEILTIRFDADGEKSAAIVTVKNAEDVKKAVSKEINFQSPPTLQSNQEFWFSENNRLAATFFGNRFIIGESESVLKFLTTRSDGGDFSENPRRQTLFKSQAAAVTYGTDSDSVNRIVEVLASKKDENRRLATFYATETRFTETGIERKTVSDFGLLGIVLKQLQN